MHIIVNSTPGLKDVLCNRLMSAHIGRTVYLSDQTVSCYLSALMMTSDVLCNSGWSIVLLLYDLFAIA